MNKLYFASSNKHKKTEMERLLGPSFTLTLPLEEGIAFDPDENGNTFIENALIKAKALYDAVSAPVLADDSGLCVDALSGAPGIHTARFGCENGPLTSQEQYTLLLEKMRGKSDRTAHFICAAVLYFSPERIYIVQESVQGQIAETSHGFEGFGYDPIFLVEDLGRTAAELTDTEKDHYSHRGRAIRALCRIAKGDDKIC